VCPRDTPVFLPLAGIKTLRSPSFLIHGRWTALGATNSCTRIMGSTLARAIPVQKGTWGMSNTENRNRMEWEGGLDVSNWHV
jgi:hypothetical protein